MPSRLLVYLAIQNPEAFGGRPAWASISRGLATLVKGLSTEPAFLETAYLSVITFDSGSQRPTPLTDLHSFAPPPPPDPRTGMAFGAALSMLSRCVQTEAVLAPARGGRDLLPMCFLFAGGTPTDDWQPAADAFRRDLLGRRANLIAVAVGPHADPAALHRATNTVVRMAAVDPPTFDAVFRWIGEAMTDVSRQLAMVFDAADATMPEALTLPPLPTGLTLVPVPRR